MDHPKNHSSVGWLDFPGIYGWPSQNRGSLSPKWMVKIMENPLIWGYPYFWKHPNISKRVMNKYSQQIFHNHRVMNWTELRCLAYLVSEFFHIFYTYASKLQTDPCHSKVGQILSYRRWWQHLNPQGSSDLSWFKKIQNDMMWGVEPKIGGKITPQIIPSLIGFGTLIFTHPFWGTTIFGNTHLIDRPMELLKYTSIITWIWLQLGKNSSNPGTKGSSHKMTRVSKKYTNSKDQTFLFKPRHLVRSSKCVYLKAQNVRTFLTKTETSFWYDVSSLQPILVRTTSDLGCFTPLAINLEWDLSKFPDESELSTFMKSSK